MTRIQQVCWELQTDYLGHPYYVSGNAIYHALTKTLSGERQSAIHASHGVFTPGQFGVFPDTHSKSGTRPALGGTLPEVETYDDLFLHRHPEHRWLLESRPRDALNAHDIRTQSGQPALAHETVFGKAASARKNTHTTGLFVHAYLHAEKSGILPVEDDELDGIQFGGQRNYGYGTTRLKATQTVDLDTLAYTRLEESDSFVLELVTPFVLRSTYPDTNDVDVPWWWSAEDEDALRTREERIVEGGDVYRCETIDHGQTVVYTGDRPVETAKNAITRVGTHSKYGFGELRVHPLGSSEVIGPG
ncbi:MULTISPECIES: hypothetical protein [Salinibaculum]|uniref:hypothetical protein n=1 Tax=Salinibaculum TaxID=2732368 RepID=UPI0030D2613F